MAEDTVSVPSCSVVICTRNRPKHLDRCLQAVALLSFSRFDVIVVDNAPVDQSAREVASRWTADYIVEPIPGLSRARNTGALACKGAIVAYLDDDAIAHPQWLDALVAEFIDPRVMVATGRILAAQPADLGQQRRGELSGMDRGTQRKIFDCDHAGWFHLANFGAIGSGGNMALRKSAFDEWRGFDVRLGRGARLSACEENYAFFELIERGYRAVYTPGAVITHWFPQTLGELREAHLRTLRETGAYLTFLFAELPAYRSTILKLMLARLAGGVSLSNTAPMNLPPAFSPFWREAYAVLSGAIDYACWRWLVTSDT